MAEDLAARGVQVRQGDYADPASLRLAFAGADTVLLVSSGDPHAPPRARHRTAIEAAVQEGVRCIVYTSHQGAHPDSPFLPCRTHAATELILAESGVSWTALRNGFYLHSLDWAMGPWRETGVVQIPADGPVSWTSRDDAAEAAAAIVLGERIQDGPMTLTASAAPTFAEAADVAADVTGRPVELEIIGTQEWIDDQIANGRPEPMARFALGIYQAAAAGYFRGTDPLLASILGREPKSVHDVFADDRS